MKHLGNGYPSQRTLLETTRSMRCRPRHKNIDKGVYMRANAFSLSDSHPITQYRHLQKVPSIPNPTFPASLLTHNKMNNWFQPPEFNYSVKSHLSYPSPPPINAAANAAAEAASAGASAGVNAGAAGAGGHPPYGPRGFYSHGHGHGYGRHHWRPRFGIFRRVVWVSYSRWS